MSIISVPLGCDGFEFCQPVDSKDYECINHAVNGVPKLKDWCPIAVKLVHQDEGKMLDASDSPWLGEHALIFKQSAVDKLRLILDEYGELLPLSCNETKLYVLNPTRVIDALDENASSIMRFSSGRTMDIERYVFRPEVVRNVHVFKIPNLRVSPVFISQHIVDIWNASSLSGLQFNNIWNSQ